MRVGNRSAPWREGEALVFDDSFEHEVWNAGGVALQPPPRAPRARALLGRERDELLEAVAVEDVVARERVLVVVERRPAVIDVSRRASITCLDARRSQVSMRVEASAPARACRSGRSRRRGASRAWGGLISAVSVAESAVFPPVSFVRLLGFKKLSTPLCYVCVT